MLKTIQFYADLLAAIQKEKAFVLRFHLTRSPADAQDCRTEANQTNAILKELSNQVGADLLPHPFWEHANQRLQHGLDSVTGTDQTSNYYSCLLERPVTQALLHKILEWPELPATQASAVTHLIAATDLFGQIRDVGMCVYARGEIKSPDILHLKALTTAFLARERLFLSMADDGLRQIIGETKATLPFEAAKIEDMLRKLKAGYAKGLIADTAMHLWFQIFNDTLGYFYSALKQTVQRIANDNKDDGRLPESSGGLEGDIEWQLAALASLPLFRGLPEKALRTVLRGSRLIDVEKNNNFITQGEPLNRLYIVMDGWIKTLKSTDEGEESILQIAGKKDAIIDNGALSITVATFSARAVTQARLLSIPIAQLREHAMRNSELAQNLLTITTTRLQKLVAQYEQITLRTATQRVGWFLVNLYLETGLEGAPLDLPFEKSLIAAYLNIKPETFSRALQQFRKEGFKIDKNKVVLPNPQALCSYCDPDIALRCCRAEAINCAPIRIAKKADNK